MTTVPTILDALKIAVPMPLNNTSVKPLYSPQEHIEEQAWKLKKSIENKISTDPWCQKGDGHLIDTSHYEDAAVQLLVAAIKEDWEVELGTDWDGILIKPHEKNLYAVLRTRVMDCMTDWNFDEGPIRVSVSELGGSVVVNMVETLHSMGWEVLVTNHRPNGKTKDYPETMIISMPKTTETELPATEPQAA